MFIPVCLLCFLEFHFLHNRYLCYPACLAYVRFYAIFRSAYFTNKLLKFLVRPTHVKHLPMFKAVEAHIR